MPTQFIKKVTELAWIRNLRTESGYGACGIGAYNHELYINSDGTPRKVWAPSDTARIYVDATIGDDASGGSAGSPVKTLTAAFALVTAARKIIILGPGEYAEPATVAWPTIPAVYVKGAGAGLTTISYAAGAAASHVINVTPGVQTGTWTGYLEGVNINHEGTHPAHGQHGVKFNNTGMTKKLLFSFKNCTFSADAETDKSIDVATHADADNAIRIYVQGDGTQMEIGGAIYFAVNNNADRLHLEGIWTVGSVSLVGADQIRVRVLKCIIPASGVRVAFIGNSGLQVVTLVGTYQWTDYDDTTPEVFAIAAAGNVTGATAVIVANA